ncbi:sphingomyelin phosphodiesterase [Gigaspora margarita]|uniref:Sphingomyelin phosphodiesterase n=3 Tax=Gigaspora margarita TaxID=4874 RepID=A0A8H3X101_GIGMA|nr:sphingomyelin phosphodiesterase [Gigaspora margarita]
MVFHRQNVILIFWLGLLVVFDILLVSSIRVTFDSKQIHFSDHLTTSQKAFHYGKKSLEELDNEFSKEILPSVTLFTDHGDILKTTGIRCEVCHAIARHIKEFLMLNTTQEITIQESILICSLLRLQTQRVCSEIIPKFGPWVITVLAHSVFSAENLCTKSHLCPKPDIPEKPEIIDLPAPITENHHITVSEKQSDNDDQKMWVVHISDWHYDSEYAEGYEVNCGEPVCCRPPNAFGDKATTPAGKWGDYNCDVPKKLIESMLEFLPTAVPKLDYIISTGDLPPHDVWAETPLTIKENTNQTANIWRKFFTSAPFLPVIGNHESAPVNSFPTSSISDIASISWLYNTLSSQWNDWLSTDVLESIEKHGFYAAKLPKDNLRVLGINTNYFYKLNLWLLMRPKEEWDPEWMLKWIVNQLDEAEKLGEKVWILGHMSALDQDAFPSIGVYFSQIVARYKDTIVGQFYGHSHWDEFNVIYDKSINDSKEPEAVGVAYIAPSVTSYKNMNPAFRVYEIDKMTKKILNHYTYSMDLQEANRLDKPEWKLLYDAKSLYGLENLEPKSWHDLTEKFIIDTDSYKTFKKTASRNHYLDKYGSCSALDIQCRNRIICKLRGTNSGHGPFSDSELCKKHGWFPHLPDDWFLSAALGKHVNVFVDMDKIDENNKSIDDDDDDDDENNGIVFEGLSKTIVRLIMRFVMGGDDAVCR